jgi:hypothetical protein
LHENSDELFEQDCYSKDIIIINEATAAMKNFKCTEMNNFT